MAVQLLALAYLALVPFILTVVVREGEAEVLKDVGAVLVGSHDGSFLA